MILQTLVSRGMNLSNSDLQQHIPASAHTRDAPGRQCKSRLFVARMLYTASCHPRQSVLVRKAGDGGREVLIGNPCKCSTNNTRCCITGASVLACRFNPGLSPVPSFRTCLHTSAHVCEPRPGSASNLCMVAHQKSPPGAISPRELRGYLICHSCACCPAMPHRA